MRHFCVRGCRRHHMLRVGRGWVRSQLEELWRYAAPRVRKTELGPRIEAEIELRNCGSRAR